MGFRVSGIGLIRRTGSFALEKARKIRVAAGRVSSEMGRQHINFAYENTYMSFNMRNAISRMDLTQKMRWMGANEPSILNRIHNFWAKL